MPDKKENIFLFYGEDTYSSNEKLRHWRNEFARKHEESNIEITEGKKLIPSDFATNLEAVPFLSEKRMIIIKDFLKNGKADDQKNVASHIERTPDFCVLIFHENEMPDKRTVLFKKITKAGNATEFPALSPPQITKWILDRANEKRIKIDYKAADHLSNQCGPELWTISNELEKLQVFADKKEITKEMIDELCTPSVTASVFKLTDAIAEKNVKQALKVFKVLQESGEDLIKVFFMIVRHFRILIQVHEMVEKNEAPFSMSKKLKQHPYVIQTTSKQAPNFTKEKLVEIYDDLLKTDIGVKTGLIKSYRGDNKEFQLAVEKLIINCCK